MDARDGDDVEAFGTLPDVFANALENIIDHRRISKVPQQRCLNLALFAPATNTPSQTRTYFLLLLNIVTFYFHFLPKD